MPENDAIKQKSLILMVFTVEGILFLIGLLWCYIANLNPFRIIYFNFADIVFAIICSLVILAINFVSINELSKFIPFFKRLKEVYADISIIGADVSISGAFIIALLSGFVEEFFFRGILQDQLGLIIASVIFGLFHVGNAKTLYYGIYAMFIGFFMGWLLIVTGNLLVPIIVHILNNFFALPYMRYYYNKYVKQSIIDQNN